MTPKETAHLIVTEDQPISYGIATTRTFDVKLLEARIEKAILEANKATRETFGSIHDLLVEIVGSSKEHRQVAINKAREFLAGRKNDAAEKGQLEGHGQ